MLAYVKDPDEIYRQSFAIIRREAAIGSLPAEIASLAVRLVHACGMPDIVEHLAFSEDVVTSARQALARGAAILCDPPRITLLLGPTTPRRRGTRSKSATPAAPLRSTSGPSGWTGA